MKNNVLVRVRGSNINRFINKAIKNNINLYNLNRISNKEITIEIEYSSYENLCSIKGYYDIEIISYIGFMHYKNVFSNNVIIYLCFSFCLLLIIFISNFTFDIKIYHNNAFLKDILLGELSNNGIYVGSYRKTYDEIERIKSSILTKYKTSFEWIEITRVGTVYEVRFEERVINNDINSCDKQNIVASKPAIIKKIFASNGVIVRGENEFVNAGDIVISGNIYLNNELKSIVCASGKIYGETWYTVKVDFPLNYSDKTYTGNKKKVLSISFLNKEYNIFNFNKYLNYDKVDDYIYSNKIIPLKLSLQLQREVNLTEYNYSYLDAYNASLQYASLKLEKNLDTDEYIISKKVLKKEQKDSTIYMEIFFKVYENITKKEIITPPEEIKYD